MLGVKREWCVEWDKLMKFQREENMKIDENICSVPNGNVCLMKWNIALNPPYHVFMYTSSRKLKLLPEDFSRIRYRFSFDVDAAFINTANYHVYPYIESENFHSSRELMLKGN